MYIHSKRKTFISDDDDSPEIPEMPSMEKMLSGWQFDKKFIEQRKIFFCGAG